MKRVLTFLAIMLLPLSLWAMTPVSDSDLSDVTGQAGVNINADLLMNVNIGTMAWGDADGVAKFWSGFGTNGGYVGVENFNLTSLHIRARTESSDNYNSYNTLFLKPITIDVATGTKLDADGVTFVRFGLGALQISLDTLQFDVSLGTLPATYGADVTLGENMGVVTIGSLDLYINPWSYVDIFATPGGVGVNFDMSVAIDRIEFGYVSWGDKDGLASGSSPATGSVYWMTGANNEGYVGLYDFRIGDGSSAAITITGTVSIDVATVTDGVYLQESMVGDATATSLSVVHISFPTDFDVVVDEMFARVVVSSVSSLGYTAPGLAPAANTELGDIYIEGMDLTIKDGSFVDIWAH